MKKIILCLVSALLIVSTAHAGLMYGVEIAESVTINEHALNLNGVGLRKKGPFKVYLAALYTPEKSANITTLLSQEGAKRVELHMLRTVSKDKMVGAIVDGFKANTSDMASIQRRVDEFITYMEKAQKGDTIQFDYIPQSGTNIVINGNNNGTIVGQDFFNALLKVWIGDKPADNKLKSALLAGE